VVTHFNVMSARATWSWSNAFDVNHISRAHQHTRIAPRLSVVAAALQSDTRAFVSWRERSGPRPNLALRYRAGRIIGRAQRFALHSVRSRTDRPALG
jgi:hypothetical protein